MPNDIIEQLRELEEECERDAGYDGFEVADKANALDIPQIIAAIEERDRLRAAIEVGRKWAEYYNTGEGNDIIDEIDEALAANETKEG